MFKVKTREGMHCVVARRSSKGKEEATIKYVVSPSFNLFSVYASSLMANRIGMKGLRRGSYCLKPKPKEYATLLQGEVHKGKKQVLNLQSLLHLLYFSVFIILSS